MDIKNLDEVLSIEHSASLTPWSKGMFVEEMKHPFTHCFIMKKNDGSEPLLIGFICFRNIGRESELLNIAVHPDYRNLGVGKKMMQYYIDFSRQRGIRTFYLEVHASNLSAIHLYQLFSYQSSGMRKKFYQGKLDALLMKKED